MNLRIAVALALERLSRREDGKLEYRLRKPLPGGATTLVLTPLQLMERLCAVMVKPRVHLTRFFGALAPNSKMRAQVVAQRPAEQPAPAAHRGTVMEFEFEARPSAPPCPRLDWAGLLRRTFGLDVFECPCGGRRRVLALYHIPGRRQEESRPAHGASVAAPSATHLAAAARALLTYGARAARLRGNDAHAGRLTGARAARLPHHSSAVRHPRRPSSTALASEAFPVALRETRFVRTIGSGAERPRSAAREAAPGKATQKSKPSKARRGRRV